MQADMEGLPVEQFPEPANLDGDAPDDGHEPSHPGAVADQEALAVCDPDRERDPQAEQDPDLGAADQRSAVGDPGPELRPARV